MSGVDSAGNPNKVARDLQKQDRNRSLVIDAIPSIETCYRFVDHEDVKGLRTMHLVEIEKNASREVNGERTSYLPDGVLAALAGEIAVQEPAEAHQDRLDALAAEAVVNCTEASRVQGAKRVIETRSRTKEQGQRF